MKYICSELSDEKELYKFYNRIKSDVPYWFDADYEIWYQSMFCDTDYENKAIFRQLVTYIARAGKDIVGFIQFGVPNYIYAQSGERSDKIRAGVIRNLYFAPEHTGCGTELIAIAHKYFDENKIESRHAFFHAFGMTCNAGHGKLYGSLTHIEKALDEHGYVKEHENVYYHKSLSESDLLSDKSIEIRYGETNIKGLQGFSVFDRETYIGAGELVYLPQGNIAYLRWIYTEEAHQNKGYASKTLRLLFSELYQNGITYFDTDTADNNIIARKLYEKNGFEDMGRTRSYFIIEE